MTGRYDLLQKINQNTFSVYIAPGRDLQIALISGPIQTTHGPISYLSFRYTDPILTLPVNLKHRINYRNVEGISGLIGAMKKDESHLLFIQYSHEHLEEYESSIPALAEECKTHARYIAPVVLLSVRHDNIIEALGTLSDRYIILSDKIRKSVGGRNHKIQKTLNESPCSIRTSPSSGNTKQYGQQHLIFK